MLQPFYLRIPAATLALVFLFPASYAQLPAVAQRNAVTLNYSAFRSTNRPAAAAFSASGTASAAAAGVFPANAYQQKFDYNYGLSNGPGKLIFRDVDGDARPEIISGANGSSVYLFKNNTTPGNISASSFPAPTTFLTGAANAVTVADMDGDNNPDLIDVSPTLDSIVILLNTPSGSLSQSSFSRRVSIPIPAPLPNDAHVVGTSDLDGDGHRDLVVSYISGSKEYVSFLRNNSSGTLTNTSFSLHLRLEYSFLTGGISIGDLDGDGREDVVVSDNANNRISILRNASSTANIAFALAINVPVMQLGTVALADIDGDGKKDLIAHAIRSTGDATIYLFRNAASPGVLTPASFGTGIGFAAGSGGFDAGDVDGDGKTDIAVGDTGRVSVFLNTATAGSITASSLAPRVDIPVSIRDIGPVTIGDLDKDGIAEIAANYTTHNGNPTGGFFILQMIVPMSVPAISSVSPLIGPLGTSVVISGSGFDPQPANNIVYFGSVSVPATAASAVSLTVAVPAGATYQPVSVLNAATGLTGYASSVFTLTFTNSSGPDITPGFYQSKIDFSVPSPLSGYPYSMAQGDLDGDGRADMVVIHANSSTATVIRNLTGTGAVTASSFVQRFNVAVGANPLSVDIRDMDGDGKPDIVVTNNTPGTVSILRNLSTGAGLQASSFAPKTDILVSPGSYPFSTAIADVNLDGKPDLIVANRIFHTVSVIRNNTTPGNISAAMFGARVDFATGTAPRFVLARDLDNDNRPDLVVVNEQDNSVSVLHNESAAGDITTATFASHVDFATGSGPTSLAIGDVDGDGKPDLITGNYAANSISVLRNTIALPGFNSGSFAAKTDFATPAQPFSITAGDANGDGKADIVTANAVSNSVSVFQNKAASGSIDASSLARTDFATGVYPVSVALGDLDGDGKPEVSSLNAASGTISVFAIAGPPNPKLPPIVKSVNPAMAATGATVTITGSNFNPSPSLNTVFFGAVKAQVQGGSATQLTATVPAGATYQPLTVLNTANGLAGSAANAFIPTFSSPFGQAIPANFYQPKVDFATGALPYGVATGDLDGDGKADLVTANFNDNTISVLRNTSSGAQINPGSFSARINYPTGTNPYAVVLSDVDGDGKLDVVVANYGSSTLSVFRNLSVPGSLGTASLAPKVDFVVGNSTYPVAVTTGDLDGDGRPELIAVNSLSRNVTILPNTSVKGIIDAGSFGARVSYPTEVFPRAITTADIDGDSKTDFIVANQNSNSISVYHNLNTGGFYFSRTDFVVGQEPFALATGDLNGDGKPDIVVANHGSSQAGAISVLRNISSPEQINFVANENLVSLADAPFAVAIADLNGDGKPDIVSANSISSTVSVLRATDNAGESTIASRYAMPVKFSTGGYPVGVAAGDLDGDGMAELLTANAASSISVFKIGSPSASVMSTIVPHGIAGVPTEMVQVNAVAYPNPNNGQFVLRVPQPKSAFTIEILSGEGRMVERRSVQAANQHAAMNIRLNLSGKPAGEYYLKIVTTDGIQILKVSVQH